MGQQLQSVWWQRNSSKWIMWSGPPGYPQWLSTFNFQFAFNAYTPPQSNLVIFLFFFLLFRLTSQLIESQRRHGVWKLLKMSHFNFDILTFWHFPPIFVLLKVTCLVTLFDRKLQIFKNSPKLNETFSVIFKHRV